MKSLFAFTDAGGTQIGYPVEWISISIFQYSFNTQIYYVLILISCRDLHYQRYWAITHYCYHFHNLIHSLHPKQLSKPLDFARRTATALRTNGKSKQDNRTKMKTSMKNYDLRRGQRSGKIFHMKKKSRKIRYANEFHVSFGITDTLWS